MGGRRRRLVIGLAVATCAAVTASMAWAVTVTGPTKIIAIRGNQILPAATPGATYTTWSNSRKGSPGLYDAYLKQPGHSKIKLNRRGLGYAGNISGTEVIYQQVARRGSNLYIYDTGTKSRHAPPGINTSGWEWSPHISGNEILFGRTNARNHGFRVLLRDVTVPGTIVLDHHAGTPVKQLLPGGVDGNWATWARYTPRTHHGNVVLYDIGLSSGHAIPLPDNRIQYAPTVNSAGDLFYVRSRVTACGRGVNIRVLPNGGSDTLLTTIPRGYDIGDMTAVDEGPGDGTTVYFDRINCSNGFWDAFKIVVN